MAAAIEIELLGVARFLARREFLALPLPEPATLGALLLAAAAEAPALIGTVLSEDGGLLAGHVLSRDGRILLSQPDEPVQARDRFLLLSTSAGG